MRLIAKRTYEDVDSDFITEWANKNLSDHERCKGSLKHQGIASYSDMVRGKMVHTVITVEADKPVKNK